MFGKLMKYEFKATSRIFVPLFSALLIVSAFSRLMSALQSKTPHVIGVTAASLLIASAFVITLILTIQRFYKNFMSNEGYLMFTLPVSTDKLIWSKLLVAAIWNIVCVAVVSLSIMIMAMSGNELDTLAQAFARIGFPSVNEGFFAVEFIAIMAGILLSAILSLYACMALSLLFNRHRVSISFAIYIAMIILFQILAVIAASIASSVDLQLGAGLNAFISSHPAGAVHAVMLIALLGVCAVGAVFFLVTRYMLKNRLNLQ